MKKQTKWLLAGMMMLAMSANVKAQTFDVDLSKQNPKSYAVEVPDGAAAAGAQKGACPQVTALLTVPASEIGLNCSAK